MQYRPEVDGLRAVAILPVVLFHAGFSAVPGGYVGVDVFFVISGYLITSLILQDLAQGRFGFRDFYARRIRRIAPTLVLALFVCIPFAWLWMLPEELKSFGKMLAATALFLSNVTLWGETGYFEAASELKPLLHTWSLSVEEQFYLIFPLLLFLLNRRWRSGLYWVLPFGVLTSFLLADWASQRYPGAAYYLIFTRAWQLLLGSWLALHAELIAGCLARWRLQEAVAGTGLLMIGIAVFSFGERTPFPGRYALLPTVGAACVIAASSGATRVRSLLASRPLVHLGLVSYALYVWHQPVLAFARLRTLGELTPLMLALLCILIYVLAWLTWRFVERPVKHWTSLAGVGGDLPLKRLYGGFLLSSTVLLGAGVLLYFKAETWHRQLLSPAVLESLEPTAIPSLCFDALADSTGDWRCPIGASNASEDFMLFGDSHALSLHHAFHQAASAQGRSGSFVGMSGCAPILGVYSLRPGGVPTGCEALNERVFAHVRDHGIRQLLLVARWTYYTDGGYEGKEVSFLGLSREDPMNIESSRAAFMAGLAETERRYRSIGVEVLWIEQVPQQKEHARIAYSRAAIADRLDTAYLASVSIPLAEHRKLQAFVVGAFDEALPPARRVSFDAWLCDAELCTIGTPQASRFSDDDHLSRQGSLLLEAPIRELLGASVP